MDACTCLAWFVMPRMPNGCTTIGLAKRLKCWLWLPKLHLLAMVVSLKATKTSGRQLTPRIGLIWRSIQTLQTVKALRCHYHSVLNRQWPPAAFYRLRRVRQRTLNPRQASTTHPWAWVPTNAPEKRFWLVSVKAMLALITMVTTWRVAFGTLPVN